MHPSWKESETTEFKRTFGANIGKEVVAFANTHGGSLFIGVEDDGTVSGVENAGDTVLQVTNCLRDSIRPDVMPFVSVREDAIGGKAVVAVHVNRGTRRPYHLASKGPRPEGVFVRQGSASVPASEAAIVRMIKETDGDSFEDALSLEQNLTFDVAKREFEMRDTPLGESHMRTLGMVNAEGLFTNLALLLSDQCPPFVKVAVFQGRKDDRTFVARDRKEFSGSLFQQLNDAYAYVDFRNGTAAKYSGLHRTDARDYPEEALREALVNAVVHRSYELNAPTLIKLYDDRLEITSPGGLPSGIAMEDLELEISIQRNPKLANVFYRLQLIEAYGFGIQMIKAAYRDSALAPTIDVTPNFFRMTLPNTNGTDPDGASEDNTDDAGAQLLPQDDATSDAASPNPTLSERVTSFARRQNAPFRRKDVEQALGIGRSTAGNVLRELVAGNVLDASGEGPSRTYRLLE